MRSSPSAGPMASSARSATTGSSRPTPWSIPDLLAGSPPALIAANGLDALTQLLEAWTSTAANPMTDALALDGLAAVRAGLLSWHAGPVRTRRRRGSSCTWHGRRCCPGSASPTPGWVRSTALRHPSARCCPSPTAPPAVRSCAATVRANIRAMAAPRPGCGRSGPLRASPGGSWRALDDATTDTAARAALVELLDAWTVALGVTATHANWACGSPTWRPCSRGQRQLHAHQPGRAHGCRAGGILLG